MAIALALASGVSAAPTFAAQDPSTPPTSLVNALPTDATGEQIYTLACAACHSQLGGKLLELATPKKPACLPCHDDGKAAFKLTGTTCKRCHTGAS